MEALAASRDPVFQAAARISGFAAAMVVETETGKVVVTRSRFSGQWGPFGHLAPGECALNVFYGTAFWERADVLGLYFKQEEQKAASRLAVKEDIAKDFRSDIRKLVQRRPEGRHELLETLARMIKVRR